MIRALVIDDEMPARSEICFMLEDYDDVKVVGEADNVRDAVALIKARPADVVFLDINMPGVNGIQLAEGLKTHPAPPALVFVTAYAEYAVKAFELSALDYLLKPVEEARLDQALDKVRNRMALQGSATSGEESCGVVRLMVDKAGRKQFVASDDILFATTRDDYTHLRTTEDHFLSSESLAKLELRLVQHGFFRVHRRYLVNLHKIEAVSTQPGGTLLVKMQDSDEDIPVSRRRTAALKDAIRELR